MLKAHNRGFDWLVVMLESKQSSGLGVITKPLCSWNILCFENKGNQIIIIFVNFTVQRNY